MAQGLLGGCTDYRGQSLDDIFKNVEIWIDYAVEVKAFLVDGKNQLKSKSLWDEISWNFQSIMESSILYFETILSDLELIKERIISDSITKREVNLLNTIGIKSREYNIDYGKYWHEDDRNGDNKIAEKMYAKGRDFFVTLQDAVNAAERLSDYMKNISVNNIRIVGNVSGSQIQQGNINSAQTIITDTEFNYEGILDGLKKIKEIDQTTIFNETFGSDAGRIRQAVDETIVMVETKKEPGAIKKSLRFLLDIVGNVGSNVIATGIISIIKGMQAINE